MVEVAFDNQYHTVAGFDKAMPYAKGVGAEGSYVKSCIRHGEIRFAVLSCFIARRAIGICFFDGTFMIAFTRLSFFCVYT